MGRLIDLTGRIFDRLTVIERAGSDKWGSALWKVQCNCVNQTMFIASSPHLLRGGVKSCGCLNSKLTSERNKAMSGIKHPYYGKNGPMAFNWKGGRYKNSQGYILIRQPSHPHNANGYILEHRLVCEKIHRRYLLSKEAVHHINGIRDDNRPENLWIFESKADHIAFHRRTKEQDVNL